MEEFKADNAILTISDAEFRRLFHFSETKDLIKGGGEGSVFRALNLSLNEKTAIKIISAKNS